MKLPAPEHPVLDTADPATLSLLSNPQSLSRAVYARRTEYTRPRRITLKVGTWNVAACPGTMKELALWFVEGDGHRIAPGVETQTLGTTVCQNSASVPVLGDDKIDLYVLGLQEVVKLNPVTQYVYSETNPTDNWRMALEAALPTGFELISSEHMSGLLLLIYASPEVARYTGNISTRAIGIGVGGWLGNKGATVARLVLGETTKIVFVNSHLSSGIDPAMVERRCWDASRILDRTRFDPVVIVGDDQDVGQDKIGDEDFAFWFGDLNFRLAGIPGDDIRRLLTLHTKGEYDRSERSSGGLGRDRDVSVAKTSGKGDDEPISLPDPDDFDFDSDPHEDPASLQATLDSLLPHDQLLRVRKEGKAFHDGWHEGPITFLPSYKYDVGTVSLFDSSEKKRAPSWCDRILYRTKRDKQAHERRISEEEEARERDKEMKARGIDSAADDDELLFDYDLDKDGATIPVGKPGLDYCEYDEGYDDGAAANITPQMDAADRIKLDMYTSHQGIMSSDHKPVVAIFELEFDAVVPELKAEVYAEVARHLDRAENEGRPSVTIVVDGHEPEPDDGSLDFGEVGFLAKKVAYFTLANTGRVPADISFVGKPTARHAEGGSQIRQWLSSSFSRIDSGDEGKDEVVDVCQKATLEPGETVNAALEVLVDQVEQARMLNDGREKLDEVLILRITDGRDHFVPVRARWIPTCIGRSIDELIRVPDGGIRTFVSSLTLNEGSQYPRRIPCNLEVHRSAPKELFKLVEAVEILTERALADEAMLKSDIVPRESPGWPFEDCVTGSHAGLLPLVIEALDQDQPISSAFSPEVNACQRLETVAEVLQLFLQGLTDGVISLSLWLKMEQASIRCLDQAITTTTTTMVDTVNDALEDGKSTIIDILTTCPNHNICFVFLTTTLAKVIAELAPVSRDEIDVLNMASRNQQPSSGMANVGFLGRRSRRLGRSLTGTSTTWGTKSMVEAKTAMGRRRVKERRIAELFSSVLCRTPAGLKGKELRTVEEKQTRLVDIFISKHEERMVYMCEG